jgi:hypothetical protein
VRFFCGVRLVGAFAGQLHGHSDVLLGQRLGQLPVGDGRLQRRSLIGANALAEILAVLPGLMLEIGPCGASARGRTVLGPKGAVFHGVELSELFDDLGASG